MDAEKENLHRFARALNEEDDAFALSLLETGGVASHSVVSFEADGFHESVPVIFIAVHFVREKVASALILLGADIDLPRISHGGETRTAVGDAILAGSVRSLALCHRLRANVSLACPPESIPVPSTTLSVAIRERQPLCLEYLLDNVFVARPIKLNRLEMLGLSMSASRWLCEGHLRSTQVSRIQLSAACGRKGWIRGIG